MAASPMLRRHSFHPRTGHVTMRHPGAPDHRGELANVVKTLFSRGMHLAVAGVEKWPRVWGMAMRAILWRPRFWLVLGWRATSRLAAATPSTHAARPYLVALNRAAEGRYWRQVRCRRHSSAPVRPIWTR